MVYEASKSVINIESEEGGLLFVSDSWYPGWKAFVDGKEVDILRANYSFRAIPVEKGEHVVRFVYEPTSLRNGFIAAAASIFLLGILALLFFGKNRKMQLYL